MPLIDTPFRAGSAQTGIYQAGLPGEFHELKWQFRTGGYIASSPAVVGGVVYFGSGDHYLYAVNIKTGQEKWKFKTGGSIASSPTAVGGIVTFGSDDGNLYAVIFW